VEPGTPATLWVESYDLERQHEHRLAPFQSKESPEVEGLFLLIQSLPDPKAKPLKRWLARVIRTTVVPGMAPPGNRFHDMTQHQATASAPANYLVFLSG